MKTEQVLNIASVTLTGAIIKSRYVNYAGATAGAGQAVLGVADLDGAVNEQGSVKTHGIILVEAGAAIGQGLEAESDANGRAVLRNAGAFGGRTLDAATAAGQKIRVKL